MNLKIKVPPPSSPGKYYFAGTPNETSDLEDLQKKHSSHISALLNLAISYGLDNHYELSLPLIDLLILVEANAQESALHLLQLGSFMEKMDVYESALAFYARAHALPQEDSDVWYFLNNNLGYCLNKFKRFKEGELFCREAIRINPDRHNAYKNLAIALEGQDQFVPTVENYILAVEKNPGDPRAFSHLIDLLDHNPELVEEISGLRENVEKCRKAVNLAQNMSRDVQNRKTRRRKDAPAAEGKPSLP